MTAPAARTNGSSNGLAIAGLVLGIIGVVLALLSPVIGLIVHPTVPLKPSCRSPKPCSVIRVNVLFGFA